MQQWCDVLTIILKVEVNIFIAFCYYKEEMRRCEMEKDLNNQNSKIFPLCRPAEDWLAKLNLSTGLFF
jgi:hypothetical protein